MHEESTRERRLKLNPESCLRARFGNSSLTTHDVQSHSDAPLRDREPRMEHRCFTVNRTTTAICEIWDEGCATRRQMFVWRRVASFYPLIEIEEDSIEALPTWGDAQATTRCVRDSSFFTSSCPVMPFLGVADAFPPRSPGGRRSARGFFPSSHGVGSRGGNIDPGDNVGSGGTARRRLLVGERTTGRGSTPGRLYGVSVNNQPQGPVECVPGMGCNSALEANLWVGTWPVSDRMLLHGVATADAVTSNQTGAKEGGAKNREGASGESALAA